MSNSDGTPAAVRSGVPVARAGAAAAVRLDAATAAGGEAARIASRSAPTRPPVRRGPMAAVISTPFLLAGATGKRALGRSGSDGPDPPSHAVRQTVAERVRAPH